jgi:hypothetical protein
MTCSNIYGLDCKSLHMQSCYILCFFFVCFVLSKWNSSIAHAAVSGDHCVLLNLNVVHTKQTELWVRIYANRLTCTAEQQQTCDTLHPFACHVAHMSITALAEMMCKSVCYISLSNYCLLCFKINNTQHSSHNSADSQARSFIV